MEMEKMKKRYESPLAEQVTVRIEWSVMSTPNRGTKQDYGFYDDDEWEY